uniref:Uncharacterized protein n=1 Tax=Tanacetum cinerariifolium TaxID=118510 RepID=A0A6L2JWC4_TANCI|nr:hypothetical protein [Tanacetum cinerariifolium]
MVKITSLLHISLIYSLIMSQSFLALAHGANEHALISRDTKLDHPRYFHTRKVHIAVQIEKARVPLIVPANAKPKPKKKKKKKKSFAVRTRASSQSDLNRQSSGGAGASGGGSGSGSGSMAAATARGYVGSGGGVSRDSHKSFATRKHASQYKFFSDVVYFC